MTRLPTISFLIPTLNAAGFLTDCLRSVASQDFPSSKIEIIVADGGSSDPTVSIASQYGATILVNRFKSGEAGKYLALKKAKSDLVAFVDSDNVLPDKNWLKRMIEPFADSEVIGTEPWEFTYRKSDGYIDRYCAMTGINDPYCYFVGNYDRWSLLSKKWTELPVMQEDKGGWIKVLLDKEKNLPTIGANGTLVRRKVYREVELVKNYFVDIDVIAELVRRSPRYFAKVKTGIIHHYCGRDLQRFTRKQKRRVKDYYYYRSAGKRAYPWRKKNLKGILRFTFSCVTIAPLFYQSMRGYLKKRDLAWFFHPIACWITFWIYTKETIFGFFRKEKMSRLHYHQ